MRNKNLKLAGFVLALCLASANFVFAKTERPLLDRAKNATSTVAATADKTANVLKQKIEAVLKLMQAQINRSSGALERMSAIYTKMQNRKDKMTASGLSTASLDENMAKAMTQKAEAAALLETLRTKYAAVKSASEPRKAAQDFQTTNKALKKKLIELHQTMTSTVKGMAKIEKDARTNNNTATSTPSMTGGQENENE